MLKSIIYDIESCGGLRIDVGGAQKYRELSDDEIITLYSALELIDLVACDELDSHEIRRRAKELLK